MSSKTWDLSSVTRNQTCASCMGAQGLDHWIAREVHSVFNSLRNCQAVFQSDYCLTFPPAIYDSFNFSAFLPMCIVFLIAILVDLKWYFIVVLIY